MNALSVTKSAALFVGLLIGALFLPALQSRSDEPARVGRPAADPMLGKDPGDVRDENGLKMKLVWCPPGAVTTESAVKGPDGLVERRTSVKFFLSGGYWIGKYEVIQSDWKRLMENEPWKTGRFKGDDPDFPASGMEWSEAIEFCRRLTETEQNAGRLADGWEYTLPTEAQWERACRAQSQGRFCFGDDETKLADYAWCSGDSRARELHRVGGKKPNAWGLHDMHGNVQEWCRDYFSESPSREPTEVPPGTRVIRRGGGGTLEGYLRVVRGGAVNTIVSACESAHRGSAVENSRPGIGFRVVLSSVQPAK